MEGKKDLEIKRRGEDRRVERMKGWWRGRYRKGLRRGQECGERKEEDMNV